MNFAIQKGLQAAHSTVKYFKHNNVDDFERLLEIQAKDDIKVPKLTELTELTEVIFNFFHFLNAFWFRFRIRKRQKLRNDFSLSKAFT